MRTCLRQSLPSWRQELYFHALYLRDCLSSAFMFCSRILRYHKLTSTDVQKNAPDRPQPAWMFPPDEENPVLNPKEKSEELRRRDEDSRNRAIKFLEYKSVTAPVEKAPPPDLLLVLVGSVRIFAVHPPLHLSLLRLKTHRRAHGPGMV